MLITPTQQPNPVSEAWPTHYEAGLGNSNKVNLSLQNKITMSEPPPNIENLNGQLTGGRARMPSPTDPKMPEHHIFFAYNFSEVPLLPNIPYMHYNHGDWAVPLRLAYTASHKWNYFHYPEYIRRTFVQTTQIVLPPTSAQRACPAIGTPS